MASISSSDVTIVPISKQGSHSLSTPAKLPVSLFHPPRSAATSLRCTLQHLHNYFIGAFCCVCNNKQVSLAELHWIGIKIQNLLQVEEIREQPKLHQRGKN